MDEIKHSSYDEPRNKQIQATHRREVFLQITLPFIIGVIVILALAIGAGLGGGRNQSFWKDIALIWLLLPAIGITFFLLLLSGAMFYLITRLIGVVPRFSLKVQSFMYVIQNKIRQASDTAVMPVKKVSGWGASIRALFGK